MEQTLQKQVLLLFHYALNPQGFLVLGPSETIGQSSDLFELVDRQHKIYTRLAVPRHLGLELAAGERHMSRGRREWTVGAATVPVVDMDPAQRAVERFLLARYAPACVLIDDGLNIRYFHGETSRYLEHVHGPASLNLQKLARPGLLIELASAIQAARTEGAPVRREGIPVDVEGESQEIDLEVMPLTVVGTDTRCFLILFAQSSPGGATRRATGWLAHLWAKGWRAGLPGSPRRKEMILLAMDDLTARVRLEQTAIFAEKERYRITLASIGEGVMPQARWII